MFECLELYGGKDVFADVIKLKPLSWQDYPGLLGWTLNAIIFIFTIRRQRKFDSHRTGDYVKIEQREI